jgi:hypothetical protein
MFKEKEAGMPSDHKLLLNGSTQDYLTWLARIEQASLLTRGIEKHMGVIRNGHLPTFFAHNTDMLDPDTVLSIPAALPSMWSTPFYGPHIPVTTITVADYNLGRLAQHHDAPPDQNASPERSDTSLDRPSAQHTPSTEPARQLSLVPSTPAGNASQGSHTKSLQTGCAVEFCLDTTDTLPSARVWKKGMFMGVIANSMKTYAQVIDTDGNEIEVSFGNSHIREDTSPPVPTSLPTEQDNTKSTDAPSDTTEGKRRYKCTSMTPESDKRPSTRFKPGPLMTQETAKASEYVSGADKFIAFLRACIHTSAHPRLAQSSEFRKAEETSDVLKAHCAITNLALFTFQTKSTFVINLKREIELSREYKLDPHRGNFPDFSAKHISAFRLLCYADPSTPHEYIVQAMTDNLPLCAPYDKIKHDIKTRAFVNLQTEEAKLSLDKLICLITDELHVHTSNTQSRTTGGQKEADLRALVFALEARAETGARRHGDKHLRKTDPKEGSRSIDERVGSTRSADPRPPESTIKTPCRNFAANRCRNGNDCRFGHPDASGNDPRVLNGIILPAYKKSIEEKNALRIKQTVEPSKAPTILTLNAHIADLKQKLAAYEF